MDACPHCKCSLLGDPIPEQYRYHNMPDQPFYKPDKPTCEEGKAQWRKMQENFNRLREDRPHLQRPIEDWCSCLPYGSATHFRREIGVEIRGVYDGVLYYTCPECGWAWNRWDNPQDSIFREAKEYVDRINGAILLAEAKVDDPKNDGG